MFVSRAREGLRLGSLKDPRLRELTLGVQLVGDDGANTPPVEALARRGVVGRLRGYMVYGDYAEPAPAGRIVRAVASGEVDAAIVWGPVAGYFASRQAVTLRTAPVQADDPGLPMRFEISMGVRRGDEQLRAEIDAALAARRAEIDAILAAYGVPRFDEAQPERAPTSAGGRE
jgi:mxaJ protein